MGIRKVLSSQFSAKTVPSPKNRELRTENSELFCQLVSRKEKAQLESRRIFRVRTVNRVVLDVGRPLLADGSFLGLSRIGRSHQLAQVGNGIFLFQCPHDDRAAG